MSPRDLSLTPEERSTVAADFGRAGARKRWGPQRVVRLDGLTAAQRMSVVELIEAYRRLNAAAEK